MNIVRLIPLIILSFLSLSVQASDNKLSPLGINTNEVMDVDTSVPFIDLFKMAMPFNESRPWLTKGKITYDKDGWPFRLNGGGQAGTRFLNNFPAKSIPSGVYTVLHDGIGKIRYGGDVRLLRSYKTKDLIQFIPKKGRITATLTVTQTHPKNYLRNIRVVMPGGICKADPFHRVNNKKECKNNSFLAFTEHHQDLVFNPDYLSFMKDFKVIRFMNMSGITRNNLAVWKDRPKMSDATWGGKEGVRGAPLEIMIKLANLVDADPWFNLPHRANNEFVKQYARIVSKNLNPTLKAYVEYTNEAWNGIFKQAHYMMDTGVRLKLDANRTYAGFKYYSRRSVEIFKLWEKEFKGTQRLVRVMGGMATNTSMTDMLLGYESAYQHVDALAIAPYFHGTQAAQKKLRSVDQVFTMLLSPHNKYSVPRTLDMVRKQAKKVARYGVDLVAYEGGQHLVAYQTHANNEGSNPYLIAANKNKRMASLYNNFLKGWKAAGGKLFVAFSAPREYNWIGSWGIKEYITQDIHQAPKYRSLMYFKKHNRCWWRNCSSTGPIARVAKPAKNPGAEEMARRFKPARTAKAVPPKVKVVVARVEPKAKRRRLFWR